MPRYEQGYDQGSRGGFLRYPNTPRGGGYGARNPLMYGIQSQGQEDLRLPNQLGGDTPQGLDPYDPYNDGQGNDQNDVPSGLFSGGNGSNIYEMLGIAANAISPNSVGGRLGGAAASYSMQNRADQRQQGLMDAQAAYRQQSLKQGRGYTPGDQILNDPNDPNSGFIEVPGRLNNLNIGQQSYGIRPDGTYGVVGENPRTALQAAPPSTPIGNNRAGFTDPYSGVEYPAQVGRFSNRADQLRPLDAGQLDPVTGISAPFSPKDTAVGFPAGSTYHLTPGGSPQVAAQTFRQSNVPVGPGGSLVGQNKVTTVPQTIRQSTVPTSSSKVDKSNLAAQGQAAVFGEPNTSTEDPRSYLNPMRYIYPPPTEDKRASWKRHNEDIQKQIQDPLNSKNRKLMTEAYRIWLDTHPQPEQEIMQPQLQRAQPQQSQSRPPGVHINPKTGEMIIKQNGRWVPYNGQ